MPPSKTKRTDFGPAFVNFMERTGFKDPEFEKGEDGTYVMRFCLPVDGTQDILDISRTLRTLQWKASEYDKIMAGLASLTKSWRGE